MSEESASNMPKNMFIDLPKDLFIPLPANITRTYRDPTAVHFLATPEEVVSMLSAHGLHLINANRMLPMDYAETPLSEWMEEYRLLYNYLAKRDYKGLKSERRFLDSYYVTRDLSTCPWDTWTNPESGVTSKFVDKKRKEGILLMAPATLNEQKRRDGGTYLTWGTSSYMAEYFVGLRFSCAANRRERVDYPGVRPMEMENEPDISIYRELRQSITQYTPAVRIKKDGFFSVLSLYVHPKSRRLVRKFYFFKKSKFKLAWRQ